MNPAHIITTPHDDRVHSHRHVRELGAARLAVTFRDELIATEPDAARGRAADDRWQEDERHALVVEPDSDPTMATKEDQLVPAHADS